MRELHQFIKKLSDLLNAGLSLQQSLESISAMKGCKMSVRKASLSVAQFLYQGNSLAAAFRQCEEIEFPEHYLG